MASALPEPLKALIGQLGKLPGVGPKSALRMAMTLLKWPESETRRLGAAIGSLRDNLGLCGSCGALSTTDPCPVCSDQTRDRDVLCIVPEWDSMLTIENGGFYHGQYLILGGLLSPDANSAQLDTERLQKRLESGEIGEVILALGSTLEAENTVTFLRNYIERHSPGIPVTRLAQGLPLGAEVRYMDSETLRQSMRNRQKL